MTWSDFKALVIEELGPDGTRRGIETLRVRAMRDGVLDLQRYIRAFRQGHVTTYQVADLETIGYSHLGTLPANAKPKAFYIISTGEIVEAGVTDDPNIVRNRLDYVAWENRHAMVADRYGARNYQYAVSPFSTTFLVHPLVNDETYLKVVWDGLKMDFADVDTVPTTWPDQMAEAVAAYVKRKILLEIDKRPDLAREHYALYVEKRLALFREQQESQIADGKDEEYEVSTIPNPAPFANFGAQGVPFLSTVSGLSGVTNAYLSAVPTTGITPNYAVQFLNGTTLLIEEWVLKTSTAADDPTNGVLRPNDYAASTNEKVWFKQS
jgi:hypothetical protein